MASDVEFVSEGSVVRGRLFSPDAEGPTPGMVMAPGFSATSLFPAFERYAMAMAEIGVSVLLFDSRGFGLSDGEPRYEVNAWGQARDYLSAVDFIRSLDLVDQNRVGVWGVSTSSTVAAVVAASDPTIAAVVLLAPSVGEELSPPDSEGTVFKMMRETVLNADLDSFERTILGPLPVISADQLHSPSFVQSLTGFRWFIEYGGRFGTRWSNQATLARLATPAPFDVQACIPHISAPILMIIAEEDEENDAALSRDVYATARDPKQQLTVGGGHFGVLYPDTPEFKLSATTQQEFLKEHLVAPRSRP